MPHSSNQLKTSPPSTATTSQKPKSQPNFVERMADDKPFDWLKVDTTTPTQK
ncbi:MAG: hypothetical protein ACRC6G_04920 [Deefgea sp.]